MTSRFRRRAPAAARPRPTQGTSLSPEHLAWLAENLARGVPTQKLSDQLAAIGVPDRLVREALQSSLVSPIATALGVERARRRRLESLAALELAHAELAPTNGVPVRERIGAGELFEHYFSTRRPLKLTRMAEGWPALDLWTPEKLRERFRGVEVEIMAERDADPYCDRNFESHRAKMPFEVYVDRLLGADGSNDVYMVSHNGALKGPLQSLLEDVKLDPEMFDVDKVVGGSSFWFGPRGTVTPLHHDQTNILFFQIQGKKRMLLIDPREPGALDDLDGFYARTRPGAPNAERIRPRARVHEVVLSSGEALFLPAGWLHEVEALERSINISFMCFRKPNDYSTYKPGFVK
jgi:hypothetical protein